MIGERVQIWSAGVVLVVGLTGACDDRDNRLRAPAAAIPLKVDVQPGTVLGGTIHSALHKERAVAKFAITKTPITVGQYRKCVASGACAAPTVRKGTCGTLKGLDGATYDSSAESAPVTCVSFDQAKAYCDWVGGRLPTESEWTLAARGTHPQASAWGNAEPTCTEVTQLSFFATDRRTCCGDCARSDLGAVATHPAGDSASGLSDVLSTHAELAAVEDGSPEIACRPPSVGCAVTGRRPGAIDSWTPLPEAIPDAERTMFAASFRCVWEGDAR